MPIWQIFVVARGAGPVARDSDFGPGEYVGVVKGVVYSIAGNAKIVDLCHRISHQSVIEDMLRISQ